MFSWLKEVFWKNFDELNYILVYRNKRAEMTGEEIVKIILFAILLIVAISGIIYLIVGKGGKLFTGIRDLFRFGP